MMNNRDAQLQAIRCRIEDLNSRMTADESSIIHVAEEFEKIADELQELLAAKSKPKKPLVL